MKKKITTTKRAYFVTFYTERLNHACFSIFTSVCETKNNEISFGFGWFCACSIFPGHWSVTNTRIFVTAIERALKSCGSNFELSKLELYVKNQQHQPWYWPQSCPRYSSVHLHCSGSSAVAAKQVPPFLQASGEFEHGNPIHAQWPQLIRAKNHSATKQ